MSTEDGTDPKEAEKAGGEGEKAEAESSSLRESEKSFKHSGVNLGSIPERTIAVRAHSVST